MNDELIQETNENVQNIAKHTRLLSINNKILAHINGGRIDETNDYKTQLDKHKMTLLMAGLLSVGDTCTNGFTCSI